MPTITSTLSGLRVRIARNLGRCLTGTASGGSTTTMTETAGEIATMPAGSLIGAELSIISGTGLGQTTRITAHTFSSPTVTLTFPAMTALDNTSVYEIHCIGGADITKARIDAAIDSAIDSLVDRVWTDTESVMLAVERGGGERQGMAREEYPFPSASFNYLFSVLLPRRAPVQTHGTRHLQTWRAFADATARTRVGQMFQVPSDCYVEFIAVFMASVGSPTGILTMTVETDSSDLPSGTTVTNGSSDTVDGSTIPLRARYQVFRFDPPILLESGTDYGWTLQSSVAVSGSNYWRIGEDDANAYSLGTLVLRDATTWTAVAGSDLLFAVSLAGNEWVPLARAYYDYRPAATDQLRIRTTAVPSLAREGAPIMLRGGAAIARPTAETTTLAIDPSYAEQFAMAFLRRNQAGIQSGDDNRSAAAALMQGMALVPSPAMALRANMIRIT